MKKLAAMISAIALMIAAATPAHAYIENITSLDSTDFLVDSDDMSSIAYLAPYNYNVADWLYATSPSGGTRSFWYDPSTDPTIQGVLCTMRGVRLGSTQEDVANAYGPALIDTDPLNDALYNTAVANGWSRVAGVFRNQARSSVSYLYRYQPSWRVGEITFYFDRYQCVCLISYATGSWPNQTFLNNRGIATAVQGALNAMGYDCGVVDGVYGPATRNAIMAWQSDNGQDPNGVIDYAVMQNLLDDRQLTRLLSGLSIAYGNDYGYEPFEGAQDLINQSGDNNNGDMTGTWDIENQS